MNTLTKLLDFITKHLYVFILFACILIAFFLHTPENVIEKELEEQPFVEIEVSETNP